MAEISHLAEARTRSTKIIAERRITEPAAHGMPNRHRGTALQFLFFCMFLCMYTTILDFGYVNFLARGTGGCARSSISGIAATGGAVVSPQVQADTFVDAAISLQFIGNAVNSNEAKLHSIFPEPSSALITCIRESCSATTLQQNEFTVRGIYDIAAQQYGINAEVFGSVHFSAAIASHLAAGVGGSLSSQRDRFPVK